MNRIEEENVIYITPTGLSVRTSGPVVYLDNWAYIELAEKNSDLRRRFLDVIHAGVDLLFSVANVAQLSGSTGRSADAIKEFLDAIGPRWFPAHMNATEVVKRESEGVPHDKACKDEYFFKTYVADQMRPFIVRGELVPLSDHLFRLGAIVDRVAGQRDSISSTSDAFDEVLRTKMTTAHDRCKHDPGLLDRKFPLLPYVPDRPATFVYYNLLRVMAVDAGSLKRGDGLDFCHATIACAFSNFAALDTRWKARVSMLPKPNRIARVYSPAELDQMIADMECGSPIALPPDFGKPFARVHVMRGCNASLRGNQSMKKATTIILVTAALLLGFFVGRRFPAHHYVEFQRLTDEGRGLLFDTTTGKICDPLGVPRGGYNFPSCPH